MASADGRWVLVYNGELYNQEFDVIKDVKDPGKSK